MKFLNFNKKPDKLEEILTVLKSIDESLKVLKGCVRSGIKHKSNVPHIVTGKWID